MISFLKGILKGLFYVVFFPLGLIAICLYAVFGIFVFIYRLVRLAILFFTGRNLKNELEEDEEEVNEDEAKVPDEAAETEDEPTFDYKFLFGLIGAIIVILIMILITIKSIKASDDDLDEDDEDDDDEDDEYYEDECEDEEEEEDDDEYEYVVVKRPKTQNPPVRQKPKSSDDFLIDIDPRYFD